MISLLAKFSGHDYVMNDECTVCSSAVLNKTVIAP